MKNNNDSDFVVTVPNFFPNFCSARTLSKRMSLCHGLLRAHSNIGATPHIARDKHRLSHTAVSLGSVLVPCGKGSGCPLTVDTEGELLPIYSMLLYFGDIVSHIID